jgi:hypothetical protein
MLPCAFKRLTTSKAVLYTSLCERKTLRRSINGHAEHLVRNIVVGVALGRVLAIRNDDGVVVYKSMLERLIGRVSSEWVSLQ